MSFDKIISEPYTELECQFILRLPEGPAKKLREALHSSNFLKDRLSIKLDKDMRNGRVEFDHYFMRAKVVDMPCIIEALKSIDKKSFYKTADISQMLVCKEDDELTDEEDMSKSNKKTDPNKVDKKYISLHGITPPMKNVRHRRFRKVLRKKHAEAPEIEKEIKRLLRGDCDAVQVRWEVSSEKDEQKSKVEPIIPPVVKQEPIAILDDHEDDEEEYTNEFVELHQNADVAEHDIFGEAVSDSDDELSRNLMAEDINHLSMEECKQPSSEVIQDNFVIDDFGDEMFSNENTYNIKHVSVKTESFESSDDFSSYAVKTELNDYELKSEEDTNEDIYASNRESTEDIRSKLEMLQSEINDLKVRIHQQELEIVNIENLALKQRFQEILSNLLSEQLQKEQQYQELSRLL